MNTSEYFQSYKDYFWQWEDEGDVVSIPGEKTIAYRDFIHSIFEKLAPQGIPPFGTLLLAVIATNPDSRSSLEKIFQIVSKALGSTDDVVLADAIRFLNVLSKVPEVYKTGDKRLLLFQTIFENCHRMISAKNSRKIVNGYRYYKQQENQLTAPEDFSINNFNGDFRPLSLLKSKFEDEHDIIEKMALLPDFKMELQLQEKDKEEKDNADFTTQLIDNSKTFHVGALIKRIWTGLNIPVHSALPSSQPLGGISDLSNKGNFDQLLLSEFANDDLIFLSRLANNEALYFQREIPPVKNSLHRIILVDISLKNWGTPKSIAFALTLAIANHPKTDIECTVFAVGDSYYPISIANIDGVIEGLQLLEGSLHAAGGLTAFFKDLKPDPNREILFITVASTLAQTIMLKTLSDHHTDISYCIYTSNHGDIDVYKQQRNGKKHVQHIQLPLNELWAKELKTIGRIKDDKNTPASYPILFRNSMNSKCLLSTADGEIFHITGEKTLLRFYNISGRTYEKGWDIVYENLPYVNGEFEILQNGQAEYVLLMFTHQTREIALLNISTGDQILVSFKEWRSTALNCFVAHGEKFYHVNINGCWSIDLEGRVTAETSPGHSLLIQRTEDLKKLRQKYSTGQSVLKNVNEVTISASGNLLFNHHQLLLNPGGHIKLDPAGHLIQQTLSTKDQDGEFVFFDGSRVRINRSGMIILISSNEYIPTIYIPSALDASLGVATRTHYAGHKFYYKDIQCELILTTAGKDQLKVINVLKETLDIGLKEAKHMVDHTPQLISKSMLKGKAEELKNKLENVGAITALNPATQWNACYEAPEQISTTLFYNKYIEAFIQHIKKNGPKN